MVFLLCLGVELLSSRSLLFMSNIVSWKIAFFYVGFEKDGMCFWKRNCKNWKLHVSLEIQWFSECGIKSYKFIQVSTNNQSFCLCWISAWSIILITMKTTSKKWLENEKKGDENRKNRKKQKKTEKNTIRMLWWN